MSNRLIRDTVCVSETVDKLTWFEEVFFYRLIVNCDDYGRTDARIPILKANLFPLKTTTNSDIEKALNKLSAVGLVYRYKVNGRPYLQFVTWEKYQIIRNKKSKYPSPEEGEPIDSYMSIANGCFVLKTDDNNCKQLNSNVSVIQSNPNQSESESKSNSMPRADKSAAEQKPVIELPLNDNTEHCITQGDIDHWSELYPAANVLQELRNMKGWLEANPAKRKTKRGILRFITNWLAKTQNKGGSGYAADRRNFEDDYAGSVWSGF